MAPQHPVLFILNGPPCAGKTHLSEFILSEFALPAMSKDIIKESLYDSLGWSDRVWSRRLSQAATLLLYEFAQSLLGQNQSCLLEANFRADLASAHLATLAQAVPFDMAQIFVCAHPRVLAQRFRERAESGKRHPGNLDHVLQHEYAEDSIPASQLTPIPFPGPLLKLDTTLMDTALAADHRIRVRHWLQSLGTRHRNPMSAA